MPRNTTILLVRHAEKPKSGPGLAAAGQARAQAYVAFFQNYALNAQSLKLNFLFAAADSSASHRPRLTITPLAQALRLKINAKHLDKDYGVVAQDILQNAKYNASHILICWHHGYILQLARALGVTPSVLPPQSNWPAKWPSAVFGWLLQVCYDAQGNVIPAQTVCMNEQLMYDDWGKNPPSL